MNPTVIYKLLAGQVFQLTPPAEASIICKEVEVLIDRNTCLSLLVAVVPPQTQGLAQAHYCVGAAPRSVGRFLG